LTFGGSLMIPYDYFLKDGVTVNIDANELNAYREASFQLGVSQGCLNRLKRYGITSY